MQCEVCRAVTGILFPDRFIMQCEDLPMQGFLHARRGMVRAGGGPVNESAQEGWNLFRDV